MALQDEMAETAVPAMLRNPSNVRSYTEATEILCLVADPDVTEDPGTSLLQSLPGDKDYKVLVVEDPEDGESSASDPNNAAYYISRGFETLISLPLEVPETALAEGGEHNAIWLLKRRTQAGISSGGEQLTTKAQTQKQDTDARPKRSTRLALKHHPERAT